MIFKNVTVKGIKANLATSEITLTFTVDISHISTATDLADYADKDNGKVEIEIQPY